MYAVPLLGTYFCSCINDFSLWNTSTSFLRIKHGKLIFQCVHPDLFSTTLNRVGRTQNAGAVEDITVHSKDFMRN